MASFGTDFILDPYAIFAERLQLALSSPVKYLALDWLISVPGSALREPLQPPAGRWLICGLGRLGHPIAQKFEELAIPYTVIDVHPDRVSGRPGSVLGRGTEPHTLLEAGVMEAVGIVACTGDDIDNLSIVMTAQELNPHLYVVTRQERRENEPLFDACGADVVARRGVILARQALLIATTPLLETFLQHLIRHDESFAQKLTARLHPMLDGKAPAIWVAHLSGKMATDLVQAKKDGVTIELSHLMHNSREFAEKRLPCLCLLLERGASRTFLPDFTEDLHEGDRLLFAGRESAQHEITWSLTEPGALINSASGRIMPEGMVRRWLARRHPN